MTVADEEPRDRPFNSYRIPAGDPMRAVVGDVLNQVQRLEEHHQLRQRARKPRDQANFEAAVTGLICDAAHRWLTKRGEWFTVPLSKAVLARRSRYRHRAMGDAMPDIVKRLAGPEIAFLEVELGFQSPFHPKGGMRTRVRAGRRLVRRLIEHDVELEHLGQAPGEETIILKGPRKGSRGSPPLVDYKDTAETMEFRREVGRINAGLEQADLRYDGGGSVDLSDRFLRRVFNDGSFRRGGRLFGGFWQAMSKKQRRDGLLIDGDKAVTLDYGQMAPRILYGRVKAPPAFEDAYQVPGLERHRAGVKTIFNAMLHSSKELARMPKDTRALFEDKIGIADVSRRIMDFHRPIRHLFYADVGMEVFFDESEILIDALLGLQERGITGLPIHDAIIVPHDHRETAELVMAGAFRDYTGVEARVSVD